MKIAEGQAEAILKVQEATAKGIMLINESKPGDGALTVKSLEAFAKAADGKATKMMNSVRNSGNSRTCAPASIKRACEVRINI